MCSISKALQQSHQVGIINLLIFQMRSWGSDVKELSQSFKGVRGSARRAEWPKLPGGGETQSTSSATRFPGPLAS